MLLQATDFCLPRAGNGVVRAESSVLSSNGIRTLQSHYSHYQAVSLLRSPSPSWSRQDTPPQYRPAHLSPSLRSAPISRKNSCAQPESLEVLRSEETAERKLSQCYRAVFRAGHSRDFLSVQRRLLEREVSSLSWAEEEFRVLFESFPGRSQA